MERHNEREKEEGLGGREGWREGGREEGGWVGRREDRERLVERR